VTKSNKAKRRKIGADAWIWKNSYRRGCMKHWKELVKGPARNLRHKKERMSNGFSTLDWWNMDSFIAGVVATGVLKFAEDGVGYFPIGDEKMVDTEKGGWVWEDGTYENYVATCGAIYYALTQWLDWEDEALVPYLEAHPGDYTGYNAIAKVKYEEAREAMILFAENLGRWWD
jgi:hypothetical protein